MSEHLVDSGNAVRLPLAELEARIMDVAWDRGGWSTVAEVHAALAAELTHTYTTTMTILVRLWRKGRLDRERDGRAFLYRPLQTREEYAAAGMSALFARVRNRPAALTHFLQAPEPNDRVQLRRILLGWEAQR